MSINQPLLDVLQRVLRLESHSFLLYVRDAGEARVAPYAREIKRTLDEVVIHEEQYLDKVLNLIEARGGHPDYAMAFEMESAGYHYLELPYLIQVVRRKLEKQLGNFRAIHAEVAELDAEAAAVVADIAERKALDLRQIEALDDKVRAKHGTSAVENNVTVGL